MLKTFVYSIYGLFVFYMLLIPFFNVSNPRIWRLRVTKQQLMIVGLVEVVLLVLLILVSSNSFFGADFFHEHGSGIYRGLLSYHAVAWLVDPYHTLLGTSGVFLILFTVISDVMVLWFASGVARRVRTWGDKRI